MIRAEDVALGALDACRARLDSESDIGFDRIADACPGLPSTIAASDWASWLPADWRNPHGDLSAGGLAELHAALVRERSIRVSPRLDEAQLRQVLSDLGVRARQDSSLWARFKAWLRSVFSQQEADSEEGWFVRWLRELDIPRAWLRAVQYLSLGLVVALALYVVVQELRAAGWLRRARVISSKSLVTGQSADAALTLAAIEAVPLVERPAMLLRLVVGALTRSQRLPPGGSLTVREVLRNARLEGPEAQAQLDRLARCAESLRYAPVVPAAGEISPALAAGRQLLHSLEPAAAGVRR